MKETLSDEVVQHYIGITRKALDKVKISVPERSHLHKIAVDFYSMAENYWKDAVSFRESGDLVMSYGAVYYAHAWLDAGARMGLFDVDGDDQLFTLAE